GEEPTQLGVRGIARQRGAGLHDRGVDGREIPLDQRDSLGPQPLALDGEDAAQLVARPVEVGRYRVPTLPRRAVMGGRGRQKAVQAQREYKHRGCSQSTTPPNPWHVPRYTGPDTSCDRGPEI